ncbi:hypothetical protein BDF20DRAFT_429336 [Mycotypha africana]|uniref:uncharacterized protein n=1 Tax=Mycotypha africana TaxID=64632 RepID=UPI0023003549|nr:uncharacterized protein BDF20DRAFT_429336 [Mycotypha africana]KAI8981795.1 hypothetical protein BDF20DRAFT_429336 [Mycotypha africana]
MGLFQLSNEILQHILHDVSRSTVFTLCLLSRTSYYCFLPFLYQHVELGTRKQLKWLQKGLCENGYLRETARQHTQAITLKCRQGGGAQSHHWLITVSLLEQLPNVTRVCFRDFVSLSIHDLQQVMMVLPRITSVSFEYCNLVASAPPLVPPAGAWPQARGHFAAPENRTLLNASLHNGSLSVAASLASAAACSNRGDVSTRAGATAVRGERLNAQHMHRPFLATEDLDDCMDPPRAPTQPAEASHHHPHPHPHPHRHHHSPSATASPSAHHLTATTKTTPPTSAATATATPTSVSMTHNAGAQKEGCCWCRRIVFPTVQSLVSLWTDFSVEAMRQLYEIMPNLNRVHLGANHNRTARANDAAVRHLSRYCSRIQHLFISLQQIEETTLCETIRAYGKHLLSLSVRCEGETTLEAIALYSAQLQQLVMRCSHKITQSAWSPPQALHREEERVSSSVNHGQQVHLILQACETLNYVAWIGWPLHALPAVVSELVRWRKKKKGSACWPLSQRLSLPRSASLTTLVNANSNNEIIELDSFDLQEIRQQLTEPSL